MTAVVFKPQGSMNPFKRLHRLKASAQEAETTDKIGQVLAIELRK